MKGLSQGVELLHFAKDPNDSEWFVAKLAVDGVLASGFSIPTPVIYDIEGNGEAALGEYLERQARSLIERYGDAREIRPDPALLEEIGA
jgi:hypothetical protein